MRGEGLRAGCDVSSWGGGGLRSHLPFPAFFFSSLSRCGRQRCRLRCVLIGLTNTVGLLEPLLSEMEESTIYQKHAEMNVSCRHQGVFQVFVTDAYGKLWESSVPGPLVHLIHKCLPRASRVPDSPTTGPRSAPRTPPSCLAQSGGSDQEPGGQLDLGSGPQSTTMNCGTWKVTNLKNGGKIHKT